MESKIVQLTVEQVNTKFRPFKDVDVDIDERVDEFSDAMKFLLKHSDLNNFIEIGVKSGGSFRLWAQYFKGIKIGIDSAQFPKELNTFPNVHGIHADSHDSTTIEQVKNILKGQLVGWLFIDGDHKRPHEDYDDYRHFVKPGGFIGFHDIHHKGHGNIEEFWNSLHGDKVEMTHSCGLGIIREV